MQENIVPARGHMTAQYARNRLRRRMGWYAVVCAIPRRVRGSTGLLTQPPPDTDTQREITCRAVVSRCGVHGAGERRQLSQYFFHDIVSLKVIMVSVSFSELLVKVITGIYLESFNIHGLYS